MDRKIVFFVIILTFILSACSSQELSLEPTNVLLPPKQPSETPVKKIIIETEIPTPISTLAPGAFDWSKIIPAREIVFWHQNTGGTREAIISKIVNDFNITNEYGIKVIAEYAGTYQQTYEKMLALQNTYRVPDIVVGYQNQVASYQLNNSIFDLNIIINDPIYGLSKEEQDDFINAFFLQDVYSFYDNQRLGLAANRNMEVMYYNMDWLKELGYTAPPRTPEEFREMACKATKQPFRGRTSAGSMGYQLTIDASRFASWAFAFGGDIYDYELNRYTFDSQEVVQAFTFLRGLFADGCAKIVTRPYGDLIDFGNGTLLFAIGSSSGLPFYIDEVANEANFNWSVASLPSIGVPKPNIYGPSLSISKSTPERQLASWIFLKYMISPEVQKLWAESTGYLPVRKSVGSLLRDLMEHLPVYKETWVLVDYAWFEPSVPGYDDIRGAVESHMEAVLKNLNLSIQSEFNALNNLANDNLSKHLNQ